MSKKAILYAPGDLVWAKMRGYPHWPARVLPYPSEHKFSLSVVHYFVFFYGTYEVAWMASKDILPYQKYKEKFRSSTQKSTLKNAVWEAEEDPNLELSKGNNVLEKYETTGKKGGGRKKRRGTAANEDSRDATVKKMKQELSDEEKQPKDTRVNNVQFSSNDMRDCQQASKGKKSPFSSTVPETPPTKKLKESTSISSRRSSRLKQSTLCVSTKGSVCLGSNNDTQSNKEVSTDDRNEEKPTTSSHGYGTRHRGQSRGQSLPKQSKKGVSKLGANKKLPDADKKPSDKCEQEMETDDTAEENLNKCKETNQLEVSKSDEVTKAGESEPTEIIGSSTVENDINTTNESVKTTASNSDNTGPDTTQIEGAQNEISNKPMLQDSHSHTNEQVSVAESIGQNIEETKNNTTIQEDSTAVLSLVEGDSCDKENIENNSSIHPLNDPLKDKEEKQLENTMECETLADQCVPVVTAATCDPTDPLIDHSLSQVPINTDAPTQEGIDVSDNNTQTSQHTIETVASTHTCNAGSSENDVNTISCTIATSVPGSSTESNTVNAGSRANNSTGAVIEEGVNTSQQDISTVNDEKEHIVASIIECVFTRAVDSTLKQTKFIAVTGPPAPPKRPIRKKKRHPPKQLIILPTMGMVDAIKTLTYNLKISLVISYQDTTQTLRHLRDLLDLTFTSSDIEEVKDLVFTLRKVRHFKHNSRVRNRAEELYSKIKSLYVIGEVRPNPKLNGKHKPQSIIRKINEAAAAKLNGECLPLEKDSSPNSITEDKAKDENVRRSQRSRGRVNYSELSGEVPAKMDDDQEVPST